MMFLDKLFVVAILICGITIITAQFDSLELNNGMSTTANGVRQCREGCLAKFSAMENQCSQKKECSMCLERCSSIFNIRRQNEMGSTLSIKVLKMVRNESVVMADVSWTRVIDPAEASQQLTEAILSTLATTDNVDKILNIKSGHTTIKTSKIIQAISQQSSLISKQQEPLANNHQCLVTWEVSGGGLMGNLLTELSNVQLSLWPDTVYHVRVTCRNKVTDVLDRSLLLTIDTSNAEDVSIKTTPSTSTINAEVNTENSEIEYEFVNKNTIDEYEKDISREFSFWPKYNQYYSQYDILVLVFLVAILVFTLVIFNITILLRRKNNLINEKLILIDNEVLPETLHV